MGPLRLPLESLVLQELAVAEYITSLSFDYILLTDGPRFPHCYVNYDDFQCIFLFLLLIFTHTARLMVLFYNLYIPYTYFLIVK